MLSRECPPAGGKATEPECHSGGWNAVWDCQGNGGHCVGTVGGYQPNGHRLSEEAGWCLRAHLTGPISSHTPQLSPPPQIGANSPWLNAARDEGLPTHTEVHANLTLCDHAHFSLRSPICLSPLEFTRPAR